MPSHEEDGRAEDGRADGADWFLDPVRHSQDSDWHSAMADPFRGSAHPIRREYT
jgi:hypothetical protein